MGKTVRFGEEVLKEIEGFPSYAVSNKGYIYRNFDKGLLPDTYRQFRIKSYTNKKGYKVVQLSNNGKRKVFYVHRLVAIYFVSNGKKYRYVRHKDGNRGNNSAENLEWVPFPERQKRLKNNSEKDILSVSIPHYLKQKLYEKALEEGKTLSSVITEILEEVLD